MNYREYQALNLRRRIEGEKPFPEIVDVIDSIMEPGKTMKSDDIYDEVVEITMIEHNEELEDAIGMALISLEKDLKISRVGTADWQKNT